MALRAEDLHFSYSPQRSVVKGISAEVRPGELLGIIGPNGSGKSTLLRLMAGLLPPLSGAVRLGDRPIHGFSLRELARHVAFLPQQVMPAFAFSCDEVVAQGRYPYLGPMGFLSSADVGVIHRCMELTDTRQFIGRPFGELSGGERQRVLIASILAQEADHLLLDEPTAALDIQHQGRVFEHLYDASRQGVAVAVVVHDLNLAAQFCDRLLLLSMGRVAADGVPREVLQVENLAAVYGVNIAVGENTLTGAPLVAVIAAATRYREAGE